MAQKKKRRRIKGSGSVQSRGHGLRIRWREKVIAADGTLKYKHRSEAVGEISKTEAGDLLRERMAASRIPKAAPVAFEDFAASWKTLILPKYPKHSTRKGHGEIVDQKLIPYFRGTLLNEMTGEHVQQFISAMEEKGYAAHSIHHYHTVLSTMLSTAKEWKRITDNPAFGAKLPRLKPRHEQWVLTPDEARELLECVPLRVQISIHLAFLLRRGEVFALRWRDYDDQACTMNIERAVYDDVIDTPKTEASARRIPLAAQTIQLLDHWRKVSKRTEADDYILAGRKGVPGDQKAILRDYIKPACAKLGLKPATWLTFRRTWNTWADGFGVSPKLRGFLVGNSAEINQTVYTKVIPENLRRAVESVGSALCPDSAQEPNLVN